MEELRWSEALAVGVDSIDDGHHALAALIDAIERAVGRGEDPSEVEDLLSRLVEETRSHFAVEDQLMKATAFPGRPAHVLEHEGLLQRILQVLYDHATSRCRLTAESARSLGNWLMRHISERDLALGQYLQERPQEEPSS